MILSPTSLTVTQYQTTTFYCSADGSPKPSVSWPWSYVRQVEQEREIIAFKIVSNKSTVLVTTDNSSSYVSTATDVLGK